MTDSEGWRRNEESVFANEVAPDGHVPAALDYERFRVLVERVAADGQNFGSLPPLAARWLLNIRLGDSRGLQLTIAAALAADIATHDMCIDAAVALATAALDRVRVLKHDELRVIDVMRKLSFGKVYRVWVDEDQLIRALPGKDTDAHRRLLARMKSRGILEEGAGKWRAIF